MRLKAYSVFLFCVLLISLNANAKPLKDALDDIIQHRLTNADVGMMVADAKTGKILYDHQGFKAFTPASNAKLLTATAALYALGEQFRFKTTASIKRNQLKKGILAGNLVLTFSGDPTFTTKKLNQLLRDVKKQGVKKIQGNVVLDNTAFTQPDQAPGWSIDDTVWYFAAPITAVMLDQNANTFELIPSRSLGKKAKLVQVDPIIPLKIKSEIASVTASKANHHCRLVIRVDNQNTVKANGCWPVGLKRKTFRIALNNPELYTMKMIRHLLKQNQIAFTGQIITGEQETNKILAKNRSRPLGSLINTVLKDSNNVYTESLTKMLGKRYYGEGNFSNGSLSIKTILKKNASMNFQEVYLADGSGLSRYDLMTPREIIRLLYVIDHTAKLKHSIKPALPYSGKEGTLSKRMKAFDLRGRIHAKTGTMKGISALSGYLTTKSGRELLFTIMINHVVGRMRSAEAVQAELASRLYLIR